MYFTVYFINTIINPTQQQHKKYYLEDENYAIFGPHIGTESYLMLTDYQMKTDYSVWPYSSFIKETGVIAQNPTLKFSFDHTEYNGKYISFFFAKATNSLVIERAVQKMTELFGFIEGTVVAFITLLFLVQAYADFSFEISLAYNIFERENKTGNRGLDQIDRSGQQQKGQENADRDQVDEISVAKYLGYALYKITSLFGKKIPWKEMQYIEECEEEIGKQLDIRNLIHRLAFMEFCVQHVLQDFQLQGLMLKRPRTAEQMKQVRQKCSHFNEKQKDDQVNQSLGLDNNKIKNNPRDCVNENQDNEQHGQTDQNLKGKSKDLSNYENTLDGILKKKPKPKKLNPINNQYNISFKSVNYKNLTMAQIQKDVINKLEQNAYKGNKLSMKILNSFKENKS